MNNHQPADLSMERHYHSPKQRGLSKKRWHIKIPLILLALFFLLSCEIENESICDPAKICPADKAELKAVIKTKIEEDGNLVDLNIIDTVRIKDMSELLKDFNRFNGNISEWDTSNVINMSNMFQSSQFTGDISKWDTSKVTNMWGMFNLSTFNSDISKWNTASVTNMGMMFAGNILFNQDISDWNTSNVAVMALMFFQASSFDQDLSGWNVRKMTADPGNMFTKSAMVAKAAKHPRF